MAKRDFYRLPDLSANALRLLRHLAVEDPDLDPDLRSNNELILNFYAQFLELKAQRDGSYSTTPEERERSKNLAIRLHENYLSNIEGTVAPIVESLREGCAEVLQDSEKRSYFYLFLGIQVFRTRKIRHEIRRVLRSGYGHLVGSFDAAEVEGVAMLYGQTFGQSVGGALILRAGEYRNLILKNQSGKSFICGDQPVVNVVAPKEGVADQMALFYPLSPTRAFLLLEKKVARRFAPVCSAMVQDLNLWTAAAAHECLIADSLEGLKEIERARPFEKPDMRRWLVL